MTALTGPRDTPAMRERDAVTAFPLLRKAASDLHDLSRADPKDTRLRDAARVLHALDLALIRGDEAVLDKLAATVDQIARANPGTDWGRSMSPRRFGQRLPTRKKADAVTAISRLRTAAATLLQMMSTKSMSTEKWVAILSTTLVHGVVEWFPELVSKRCSDEVEGLHSTITAMVTRQLHADDRAVPRRKHDAEKIVVIALVAFGMTRDSAWGRVKRAR